jgi:chitinase
MRVRRKLAVVAAALCGVGLLTAIADTGTANAATSGGAKIAYYDQWSIYGNAYYPKNLDTSGVAGKLDYLIYDFENIDPVNLTCLTATKASDSTNESNPNAGDGAGDAYADYQKTFDASTSVSGVADTWNQPLVGNFNQLKELKAKYPNLKILLSIGGWTYSKYFSDVAATAASRQKFVSSCVDLYLKGNLPVQGGFGGTGAAAGIFDGFDLDWEYPGTLGHVGNHYSANDKANYTSLLSEFRSEIDAYGSANGGKKKYLTAAVPAGQDKISQIETNKVGNYLDFANVMTYDMHGAFEPTQTNNQSPLYQSPTDPSAAIPPGTAKYSIDTAITAWTSGLPAYGIPGGFPAGKLTMGIPFYYRGWSGVPAGSTHGLYQSATGASSARPTSQVAGVAYYKELTGIVDNPADTYWDASSQSAYFYNGSEFFSGENAQSIKAKIDYAHCKGLGGAMMFSLLDLDSANTLFNATVNDVNAAAPASCGTGTTPPTTTPTTTPTTAPTTTPPTTTPPTTTPPTTTPPTGSCTAAAWSSTAVYVGGNQVSYNGHAYTAKWWTQGETPGVADVWTDNGACGGGTTTPPTGSCPAAWVSSTAYVGGSTVSYNGHKYTAKWWTQAETPGVADVWTDNGAC